jgi:outer membrane receptor protein involved in Fe transport
VTARSASTTAASCFAGHRRRVAIEAGRDAYRADVTVGVADFIDGRPRRLALYGQSARGGLCRAGHDRAHRHDQFGGVLGVPITKRLQFTAKGDRRVQDDGLTTRAAELDLGYQLADDWTLGAGVRNDDRKDDSPIVPLTQDEGERTDAAVKLGFDPKAAGAPTPSARARWRSRRPRGQLARRRGRLVSPERPHGRSTARCRAASSGPR